VSGLKNGALVFVYSKPTDLRKSFYTLSTRASKEMERDPLSGDAFIFINARRTLMKCLIFEYPFIGLGRSWWGYVSMLWSRVFLRVHGKWRWRQFRKPSHETKLNLSVHRNCRRVFAVASVRIRKTVAQVEADIHSCMVVPDSSQVVPSVYLTFAD